MTAGVDSIRWAVAVTGEYSAGWQSRDINFEPFSDFLNPLEARALYELMCNMQLRDVVSRTRSKAEAHNALSATQKLADWLIRHDVRSHTAEPPDDE